MRITIIKKHVVHDDLRYAYSYRITSPCGHLRMQFDYYKEQSKSSGQWVTLKQWRARRSDNDFTDFQGQFKGTNKFIVAEAKAKFKDMIDNLEVEI